jgi:hypothetical protein
MGNVGRNSEDIICVKSNKGAKWIKEREIMEVFKRNIRESQREFGSGVGRIFVGGNN